MTGRFLPGVPGPKVEAIFNAAAGNEIASGKFDSPESSAALAANAFGFLPGTAHVELAAGPTPPLPLLPGPRQRPQPIRHLSFLEAGALGGLCRSFWRGPG